MTNYVQKWDVSSAFPPSLWRGLPPITKKIVKIERAKLVLVDVQQDLDCRFEDLWPYTKVRVDLTGEFMKLTVTLSLPPEW